MSYAENVPSNAYADTFPWITFEIFLDIFKSFFSSIQNVCMNVPFKTIFEMYMCLIIYTQCRYATLTYSLS